MCKLPSESFVQSVHCPSKVSVWFQSVLSKVSDVSFLNKFCSDLPTRCNTEYPSKFWHDLFTCVIEWYWTQKWVILTILTYLSWDFHNFAKYRDWKTQGLPFAGIRTQGLKMQGYENEGIEKCRDENGGIGIPGMKPQGWLPSVIRINQWIWCWSSSTRWAFPDTQTRWIQ